MFVTVFNHAAALMNRKQIPLNDHSNTSAIYFSSYYLKNAGQLCRRGTSAARPGNSQMHELYDLLIELCVYGHILYDQQIWPLADPDAQPLRCKSSVRT